MSTFFKTFEAYTDNISSYNRNLREIKSNDAKIEELSMTIDASVVKYTEIVANSIDVFKNDSLSYPEIQRVRRVKRAMFVNQELLITIDESLAEMRSLRDNNGNIMDHNHDLKREIDNQLKSMRLEINVFSDASKKLISKMIDDVGLAE